MNATLKQLCLSSSVPVSENVVREGIGLLARCVPWFCQIIKLNGTECLSSTENTGNGNGRIQGGKENGKDVEGLLIFAKRGEKLIGREDVLNEFRAKRLEWENTVR